MLTILEVLCVLLFLMFRWCIQSDVVVVHNVIHFKNQQFPEMVEQYFVRLHKLEETNIMAGAAKSKNCFHLEKCGFS